MNARHCIDLRKQRAVEQGKYRSAENAVRFLHRATQTHLLFSLSSFDVDGSSSPRGILNSHHNVSSTSTHYQQQQYGTGNKPGPGAGSGMHRRESFLYKCDSDNDLSPNCISRNPSIGSEL